MLDTILFDLDGTLLPMRQDDFVHAYFSDLARYTAPMGYDKERLIPALWHGTMCMTRNDGAKTNRERFWEDFSTVFGDRVWSDEPSFDHFYANEFDRVRRVVHPRGPARPVLDGLRQKGYGVVLATNPLFPRVAVETRLGWIGLKCGDFDLVTTYENSRYCKPNPDYYHEIFAALSLDPARCLMVGNNTDEDMTAAQTGAQVYLLTDFLENASGAALEMWPHGGWDQMTAMLDALPALKR